MRGKTAGVVVLLFATAALAARDERDDRDEAMVCVPAEDGRSWECGTRSNPPPERGLTVSPRSSTAAAPPPFLAAPGGRSPIAAPATPARESARDAFAAPPAAPAPRVAPIADAPATAIEPLPASTTPAAEEPGPTGREARAAELSRRDTPVAPAAERAPASAARAGSAPPPLLAAPRPRLAPYAPLTPAPTASAPPVAMPATTPSAPPPVAAAAVIAAEPSAAERASAQPAPAQPDPAETAAAETAAAEPAAADPVPAAPVAASTIAAEPAAAAPIVASPPPPAPRRAENAPPQPIRARVEEVLSFSGPDEFLALPPSRFTLQIARAPRAGVLYAEFQRLRALGADGLAERVPYIVTIGTGDAQQSLLLWADFADAAAARAAWDALPTPAGGKPAAYARRIAPLQDEVRRAPSNR